MARLDADVEGRGADAADVVIEAIFENADAKRELYARIEPRLKQDAILATNTSSIMLEALSTGLADPGRLVGLHFFNPVAQMPLVEVIDSQQTHARTQSAALAFTRSIDKLPLPCRSAPGFLVNRVLMPYLTEAMLVAQEGVPLADHRSRGRALRHADGADRARRHRGTRRLPARRSDTRAGVRTHRARIGGCARGSAQARPQERRRSLRVADGKPVKPPAGPHAAPGDLVDRLMLPMVNEADRHPA